jgi:hypothetical protein
METVDFWLIESVARKRNSIRSHNSSANETFEHVDRQL